MPTLRRAPREDRDAAPELPVKQEVDASEDEAITSAPTSESDLAAAPAPQNEEHEQVAAQSPSVIKFPAVAAISFAIAGLGYSALHEYTRGELAAVSRSQETWEEVGILTVWRIIELAVAWFGNFDSLDVATLDLLSHGPTIFLLTRFYNVSPVTALAAMAVDILSAAVPFSLLRPLSAVHKRSIAVPNRELIDLPLQLLTTVLSTSIYTVTLVLSLRFVLPRVLVLYFNGLPSVEPAYTASYDAVLPVTVLFGAAASIFVFAPFATTGKAKEDELVTGFDPVDASLGETVWWNFWGYTAKAKVVIRRTTIAMFITGVNTYLACTMIVPRVEPTGAAAYSAVWVLAALFTGIGLGFVGRD